MSASSELCAWARESARLSVIGVAATSKDPEDRAQGARLALEASRLNRRDLADVGAAFTDGMLRGVLGPSYAESDPDEPERPA